MSDISAVPAPRTHKCGQLRVTDVGATVSLRGWLQYTRRVGKGLVFATVRDATGAAQFVVHEATCPGVGDLLHELPKESVIAVSGVVRPRPSEMVNSDMPTGGVEVAVEDPTFGLVVLNRCKALPFPIELKDDALAKEELRMRHRYLDLRRPEVQDTIRMRSDVCMTTRKFFVEDHEFVEVETPTLFKRTPGGAAEFLVPTQNPGQFYSLVQSPQQFKQLLMVGGVDRYFQLARCYRDEGGRGDRQPEFTQVDIELSFTTQAEIQTMIEQLIGRLWSQHLGVELQTPFPRMPFRQAMQQYGVDKPDTRFDMRLCNVTSLLQGSSVSVFQETLAAENAAAVVIKADGASKFFSRKQTDQLQAHVRALGHMGVSIFHVGESGETTCSALRKQMTPDAMQALAKAAGGQPGDCLLLAVGQESATLDLLGKVRLHVARLLEASGLLHRDPQQFNFLWVEEFPLFEEDEDEPGRLQSSHHCFTAPVAADEELVWKSPLEAKAQHFDLVLNGVELGGGSIRNHNPDIQLRIIKDVLQEDPERFRQILDGLQHGAPPHGGIALGLDRLIMTMRGAASLRDVLAFPKSFAGRDLMSNCPSEVPAEELDRYHLRVAGKPE